jgi:hypothetical protein
VNAASSFCATTPHASIFRSILYDCRRRIALRRASADLAVAIHALSTPVQRTHAQHKIDDLIRDLTELSQEN